VSLGIRSAERVGILGPSGSGKTTVLRLIAGLETPDAGTIRFDDRCMSTARHVVEPHRRGLGFVFQRPALWPHLTVAQNILFALSHLPREEARRRLDTLAETMEIGGLKQRRPDELSAGQARRVALARALAPQPQCVLMDEPLTNLDRELKQRLLGLIRDTLKTTQAGLIYVSHDDQEVAQVTDRVVRLAHGRLEE
jgi:iron(III) transport system ATP-binding protein